MVIPRLWDGCLLSLTTQTVLILITLLSNEIVAVPPSTPLLISTGENSLNNNANERVREL